MTKKLGCIGWGIMVVLAVVLVFVGGQLLFVGLEVLALAFTRVGVSDPALAWGLTGAALGAAVGAVVGLRRAGRKRQLPELALAVALVGGLAFLGADAAGGYVRAEVAPSSVLFEVVVTAEELNVRPAPSTANDPLTVVARGQRLGVTATEPEWYAVRFTHGGREYEGWISSAYTTRADAVPPPEEAQPGASEDASPGEAARRSVVLPPSVQTPLRLAEGQLDVQVLRGSAEPAPALGETRVELRVEERSLNVVGTWPPWSGVARRSYLTDARGARYPASAAESVGPGGSVVPGRVRQGTLVIYVPLPPEDVAALTLVYASGDAPPVRLPLDGHPATGR